MFYSNFTKKRLIIPLVGLVSLGVIFSGSGTIQTARAATFDAGTLTSDAFFTARDTMSAGDIQAFLQSKGSVLASISSDQLGEGANGRSAAQIIYDASRVNRTDFARRDGYGPDNPLVMSLNPQVLLITLQKEQSLITAPYSPGSPSTVSALRSAMGYGCPDSGGCSDVYSGFTNQVVYAGAQFMRNFYQAGSSSYKPGQTYTITNTQGPPYNAPATQQVRIANSATSSLYQYTPHVYNGNYNFWYYSNLWFAQTVFNPTLAKDVNDPAVYIIDRGVRYPVDSAQTFDALRLNWNAIGTLSDAQRAMPIGPMVKRLSLGPDRKTVFLLDKGQRHRITSARIFNLRGFDWGAISQSTALMDSIPEGLPVYELTKPTTSSTVYIMSRSRGYAFPSADIFADAWGMNWNEIAEVPMAPLLEFPLTSTVTRVAQGRGSTVYLMDRGRRLAIPSPAVFSAWKFDWNGITYVEDQFLNEKPEAAGLTQLAKGSGSTVYYIDGGRKRPVTSAAAFERAGFKWGDVREVSNSLLDTLPNGSEIR